MYHQVNRGMPYGADEPGLPSRPREELLLVVRSKEMFASGHLLSAWRISSFIRKVVISEIRDGKVGL